MKKKAQAESIIIFFGLMVGIFIASIIVLRMVNSIMTPLASNIGNISAQAGAAVTYTQTAFGNWWDILILMVFLLNVLLLFVSAFLIDIHPAFVIIYILAVLFLFIFGNFALNALDNIWLQVGRSEVEGLQTTLQQFIINHFMAIMLGVIILSGIIMYSKIKYFSNFGSGGGNY